MSVLTPDMMYEWEERRAPEHIEFQGAKVDVLDITTHSTRSPSVRRQVLQQEQLAAWVEESADVQVKQSGNGHVHGHLRLIVGCYDQQPGASWSFPFTRHCYELVCEKFHLPRATTVMISKGPGSFSVSHFQVYKMAPAASENGRFTASKSSSGRIGITMKLPGSDLVGMDTSLSLSYDVAENSTSGFIICRYSALVSDIVNTVMNLASLATHPAGIPALLCSLHQHILLDKIDFSWEGVYQVENASGQSGISLIVNEGGEILPPGNCDDPDLSKKATLVTQYSIAWETYTSGSQALISAVKSFLKSHVLEHVPEGDVAKQSLILQEYLDLISQRADSLYYRAKHLRARAEVQVGAINNHLAHRSNQINLSLADSSQRIAMDARRDSSVMKSIAVLTMIFLPATYIASLFATPGVASANPTQRLYWGVTIPTTLFILAIWFAWTFFSEFRDRSSTRCPSLVCRTFTERKSG